MALELKDLQAVLDINQKINSIQDVKSILRDISHYAGDLIEADGASILLMDPKTGDLHFEVAFGESAETLHDVIVPRGKGIAGYVAETMEPLIVNDTSKDSRFYNGVDQQTNIETKAIIAMPMIHQNRLIGVIEVINPHRGGFGNDDVLLLRQFAELAATAITNALLYKKIKDKYNELEYLFQISNLTNQEFDRKELFSKIVKLLSDAFCSRRVSVMLVDETSGNLYIESAIGIPGDVWDQVSHSLQLDKISSRAITTGKPLFANHLEREGFGKNKKLRYHDQSFICVPIKVKNIPVGVINLSEPKKGFAYSQEIIKTLETIANQIGHTYESIQNYEDRVESEKIRKEVEIMKSLQNALLLKDFNDIKNLSIYARMKPAEVVGGDFYDVYHLSPTKVGFVIGDVSGKGLPASLYMAVSRSVIKAYAYQMPDPKKLFENANTILVDDSRVGMFVTLFYGLVDLESNTLTYSNAGHNLQYLYRPSSGEFLSLATRGIPLGISREENYQTISLPIHSGDIIFTFTDGIVDAVNDHGEDFGISRLKDTVKNYSSTSAVTLVNAIMREVDNWAGNTDQWDDMTVVAVKIP